MVIIFTGSPSMWGLILSFLDEDDPRPAREQFNDRYIAGWNKFEGFTMVDPKKRVIQYRGADGNDPPLAPLSDILFRKERLLIYDYGWVMIVQPNGSWEVARMD